MQRRAFLRYFGAGASAAFECWKGSSADAAQGHTASGNAGKPPAVSPRRHAALAVPNKLDQICISTRCLHNYFRGTRDDDCNLPGPMLALLDFPDLVAGRYKVRHFEFCSTHFASATLPYLQELRYALVRTRSTVVNIPVDIEECGSDGTFSDPDPKARQAALDAAKGWVDVAHVLGARSVRVAPGKVDGENLTPTVESYRSLSNYALAKGIRVVVENQGGFGSENPEDLVKLFKLVGAGRIGALPNLGNFPDQPTREQGLKLLFPYAPTVCHAKALSFDAVGPEAKYDFPPAIAIARKGGFRGVYSIEFEGPGDPYAGIQETLDELLKYL